MKWQSASIYLVLSWNTILETICSAAWLSQDNEMGVGAVKPILEENVVTMLAN